MSGSVNKVIIVGNLGQDPEVRHSQSGDRIVTLNVATGESWKDQRTGERRERVEWHRVVIFNERHADIAERFLRKGRKVYLEGALRTRKWQDQSGADHYTTEIVLERYRGELTLLDHAREDDASGDTPPRARASGGNNASSGIDDSDIPF